MRKFLIIPLILIIIIAILGVIANEKSGVLVARGDLLLQQNKPLEALLYYKEAQNIFPLRQDAKDNINSLQLVLNSQNEYNEIIDAEYAEVQTIPALQNLPAVSLKSGEYFVPILMYHHIRINPHPELPLWASLNVTPDELNNELNYLSTNKFHVITLTDLYNIINNNQKLPDKPIILTFDDGYANFYENAFPLLKKYKMKAIEFVITQVETAPAYLSWDQIIDLDKSGLVEIGAHTQHHPFLTDLTASLINKEIMGSKSDIESHLGHKVNWFAYPYGAYNNFIIEETQKAGFLGAVSVNYSSIQNKDKLFVLPRIQVDGRFTLDEFAKRVRQ
jgi:peptidoglycan/xylan/chitin deacetylase (PgdA/CDA1 family)